MEIILLVSTQNVRHEKGVWTTEYSWTSENGSLEVLEIILLVLTEKCLGGRRCVASRVEFALLKKEAKKSWKIYFLYSTKNVHLRKEEWAGE